MKKLLGGLLMAATILVPIVPAAAQDRGQRGYERTDYDRKLEQRRGETRRQVDRRTPEQRREDLRRQQQRGSSDWRNNDRRDRDRRDNVRRNYDRRDHDRRDNRNWNNNQSQNREWNRGWRNDRRYDYRSYRNSNRNAYRMPRYQIPYRGHSYSRFNIGMGMNSSIYNRRYWINNPSYYRLPAAYGNYRWVRYYNDAILVDTRRGRVVDVLYNFFW